MTSVWDRRGRPGRPSAISQFGQRWHFYCLCRPIITLVKGRRGERRMTSKTNVNPKASERYTELQRILEERRREILSEVKGKMRDVRSVGAVEGRGVLDAAETSEADIQDDIEFALIQMKS